MADWREVYGVEFTPWQIEVAHEFPWGENVLYSSCPFNPGRMVCETHVAFLGLETINIMVLQRLNPANAAPRFYDYLPNSWYSTEAFANEVTLSFRWYLLLRGIVPNSEDKTFKEQTAMLPGEYEVPSAVAETAKNLLIFKKIGVHVNGNRYARTADLDSARARVSVGVCDTTGVRICDRWDDFCSSRMGVGASRKPE